MSASHLISHLTRSLPLALALSVLPQLVLAKPPAPLSPLTPLSPVPRPPPALPPAPNAITPQTQVQTFGWTDANSERAASTLVAAVAASPWVARFTRAKKRVPRLRLLAVRNRTPGHVNTRHLEQLLEKKITASIELKLVAGSAGRFQEDVKLEVWMLGQNDRSGGTTLDSTLVSLVGRDATSGYEVVRALFERRKLIVMPRTTAQAVPGKPPPPPGQPKITVLKPDQRVDLSGFFNDVDARSLARSALKDALKSGWLRTAKTRPIIKLYGIRNRTMEHVQLQVISERLAAGLLASGKARLQGPRSRGRLDPKNTVVISGHLTSQVSALSATQTRRVYRLNLEAVNVDSQRKVWVFSRALEKIVVKKTGARKSTSW